ncbi:UxaA family hydrolase [Klebsiella pneumoniae]|uniref:UxaA family hydrolase n=1 Tax=Klebsiella pneumoniae TaxID=573 RepID=UPI001D0D8210
MNAGSIIDGVKTKEEVRDELIELIVRISDGELVKAELNEQNDFSVWRLATTC